MGPGAHCRTGALSFGNRARGARAEGHGPSQSLAARDPYVSASGKGQAPGRVAGGRVPCRVPHGPGLILGAPHAGIVALLISKKLGGPQDLLGLAIGLANAFGEWTGGGVGALAVGASKAGGGRGVADTLAGMGADRVGIRVPEGCGGGSSSKARVLGGG